MLPVCGSGVACCSDGLDKYDAFVAKTEELHKKRGQAVLLVERFFGARKKKALVNAVQNSRAEFGIRPHIVISLTSYPARFNTVCKTLKSLLNQNMKPDRIIVYLDVVDEAVTTEMRDLEKYGIEYRTSMENLKPHTKYFLQCRNFRRAS